MLFQTTAPLIFKETLFQALFESSFAKGSPGSQVLPCSKPDWLPPGPEPLASENTALIPHLLGCRHAPCPSTLQEVGGWGGVCFGRSSAVLLGDVLPPPRTWQGGWHPWNSSVTRFQTAFVVFPSDYYSSNRQRRRKLECWRLGSWVGVGLPKGELAEDPASRLGRRASDAGVLIKVLPL